MKPDETDPTEPGSEDEHGSPLPAPGAERPRFLLLPEGCVNVTDTYGGAVDLEGLPGMAKPGATALKEVVLPDAISVSGLASLLQVQASSLLETLEGMVPSVTLDSLLDFESAAPVCLQYGFVALRSS